MGALEKTNQTREVLHAPPIELDPADACLCLEGERVHLGGKALALLQALMERPRRLVTKDELIDAVWEGRAVSDAVLTTAMRELRQGLKDPARSPQYIQTVHGRGYRFLLPVERGEAIDTASSAAPQSQRDEPSIEQDAAAANYGARYRTVALALASVALFAVSIFAIQQDRSDGRVQSAQENPRDAYDEMTVSVAHPKSITITPFTDMSEHGGRQWFANGLTDEVGHSLAQIPDLRVVLLNSASDLGEAVQSAHRLEGSVRSDGERVRVVARLIKSDDGATIWSQQYDHLGADIITIQEKIAYEIAQSLRTVTDPEKLRGMVEAGTRNVAAYEALLEGRHLMLQYNITGEDQYIRDAHESYERAREIDPSFDEAHWLAALYWFDRATTITPPGEAAELSVSEISALFQERVVAAIDAARGDVAEPLYQAAYMEQRLEYRTALDLLGGYLKERPSDVFAWLRYSYVAQTTGDYAISREAAQTAAALTDESSIYFPRVLVNFIWAQDFEGALRLAQSSVANAPENIFILYNAHRILLYNGKIEEARNLLRRIEASSIADRNKQLAALRQACAEDNLVRAGDIANELRAGATTPIAIRWLVEMLMDQPDAAAAVLSPYDQATHLHQLAGFIVYPHFDSSKFPQLSKKLISEGIDRPAALPLPFRCRAA